MKPLKDISWLQLKPKENLRARQSNQSLKAPSTTHQQSAKTEISHPSLRRSSDGTIIYEELIKQLSPRPEPDSGVLTPEPLSLTSGPTHGNSTYIPDCHEGNTTSELAIEMLVSPDSTEIIPKPENILPVSTQNGEKQKIGAPEPQESSPPTSEKELSASLEGLHKAVKAMGLRSSQTISPLSFSPHDSMSDLIQSSPDSPEPQSPPGTLQVDYKWKPAKRMPRIDVSENSIDDSPSVSLPLSNTSNTASVSPNIQAVPSSDPAVAASELAQSMYDGHASMNTVVKDLSHMLDDCPTISEVDEAHLVPAPPSNPDSSQGLNCEQASADAVSPSKMAVLDGNFQKHALPSMQNLPAVPMVSTPTEGFKDGSIPIIPGIPGDCTGLATAPATPPSNLTKRQKMKVRGRNLIRLGRRIIMRKSILTILLGRQLAGPTVEALRKIYQAGGRAISTAPGISTAPDPVSI